MNIDKRIYVAGHNGMVGSSIVRALVRQGYKDIVTSDRSEVDLTNQAAVSQFFKKNAFYTTGAIFLDKTTRARTTGKQDFSWFWRNPKYSTFLLKTCGCFPYIRLILGQRQVKVLVSPNDLTQNEPKRHPKVPDETGDEVCKGIIRKYIDKLNTTAYPEAQRASGYSRHWVLHARTVWGRFIFPRIWPLHGCTERKKSCPGKARI